MVHLLWETVWQFLKRLNNKKKKWVNNFTLRHIDRRTESRNFNNTYRPRCIGVLFTIAKSGNNPCPSTDEWINMLRHVPTMEYDSATGRNEAVTYVPTWKILEHILLSERSQTQEGKDCIMPLG